jgi:hypothetical protein
MLNLKNLSWSKKRKKTADVKKQKKPLGERLLLPRNQQLKRNLP